MNNFVLRDWAVGQKILATDLQQHTDRINSVTPISFSGNVRVQGGDKHGIAVYIPDQTQLLQPLPMIHITSAATGGGQYIAREVSYPDTWASTADLTATNLGDDGDDDVLFINLQEIEAGTHWLTNADNTDQLYFYPDARWPIVDEEGRTIYASNAVWVAPCPTPTPSPSPPP